MYYESHYHSTTHEALGIFKGSANLRFGVADAESSSDATKHVDLHVEAGDVLVIPAGVAHRCITEKGGFKMDGFYPVGAKEWNMNCGGESEATRSINVPVPGKDPVVGDDDVRLKSLWK